MAEVQNTLDVRIAKTNLKRRYIRLNLVLLLFGLFLFFWVCVVYSGIIFWDYGHNWAGLSFEYWIIIASILIAFFIILELIFYRVFSSITFKGTKKSKAKAEYLDGKKVYTYTIPKEMEGGIFSKTYVHIDGENMLRLRTLMIPPDELWGKKKKLKKD